jgi:hypothetical protein
MDPSTDAVVADVRDKRLLIDRRIELIRERVERFNPTRFPWQAWAARAARAWPFIATGMAAWLWRRYRYNHRFMRLP